MPRGVDRHDRVAGLRTLQGCAARARVTTDLVDRGPTKTTLLADALAKELSPLAALMWPAAPTFTNSLPHA